MATLSSLCGNVVDRVSMMWRCVRRCDVPGNLSQWMLFAIARGHPFDGWKTRLSRIMRKGFPKLALKGRWGGDWTLTFDPGDISQMVIFEELVIDRTWDLDRVPFEPDLIIDAGSHIGLFATLAGVRFRNARVICIEPDRDNLGWLQQNLSLNHVSARVIEGVVGEQDGAASFQPGLSYGGRVVEHADSGGLTRQVESVSLSRLIQEENPQRLLLKIDIEGSEEVVLPPVIALLRPPCFLFLETHGGAPAFDRLAGLLKTAGFEVTLTRAHGLMRECYAITANA